MNVKIAKHENSTRETKQRIVNKIKKWFEIGTNVQESRTANSSGI